MESGHQFALRLRQVEGGPVHLCEARDQEDEEAHRLREELRSGDETPIGLPLLLHDIDQAERLRGDHYAA